MPLVETPNPPVAAANPADAGITWVGAKAKEKLVWDSAASTSVISLGWVAVQFWLALGSVALLAFSSQDRLVQSLVLVLAQSVELSALQ